MGTLFLVALVGCCRTAGMSWIAITEPTELFDTVISIKVLFGAMGGGLSSPAGSNDWTEMVSSSRTVNVPCSIGVEIRFSLSAVERLKADSLTLLS